MEHQLLYPFKKEIKEYTHFIEYRIDYLEPNIWTVNET